MFFDECEVCRHSSFVVQYTIFNDIFIIEMSKYKSKNSIHTELLYFYFFHCTFVQSKVTIYEYIKYDLYDSILIYIEVIFLLHIGTGLKNKIKPFVSKAKTCGRFVSVYVERYISFIILLPFMFKLLFKIIFFILCIYIKLQ